MKIVAGILLWFTLLFAGTPIFAQLEFVAPITVQVKDTPKVSGLLLLNTMDFHSRKNQPNQYPSSLQILNPGQPWPPVFFVNAAPGGEGLVGNGAFQDFKYHPATKQFSFFYAVSKDSAETDNMYIICDSNLQVVDTFRGVHNNIDAHDFQISPTGEYLYMATLDTVLNITSLSENPADTAVLITTQKIEIADKNRKLVFTWNPFDHFSITEMYWEYHTFGKNWTYKGMDWSHGNSIRFTIEGNILYSFRFIGIGKINRKTGEPMWKLGGKFPTIPVPAEAPYVLQHDFHEVVPGVYSIFSNGDDKNTCKAIWYKIHDKTGAISVAHTYQPEPPFVSKGLGSYNCNNGFCVFNYGLYITTPGRQKAFEVLDTNNTLLAEYSTPDFNFPFQVHRVDGVKLKQPQIVDVSGTLQINQPFKEIKWYRIADGTATYLSNTREYKPVAGGTYLAVRAHGFGWLTSEPYTFTP